MNLLQPIAKWEQQDLFHTPGSEGAGPACVEHSLPSPSHDIFQTSGSADTTPQNGDNPSLSFSISLNGEADTRVKDTRSNSDPTPAEPGA